ncbi:hypothetical protein HBH82_039350 [Parastagonospora nodorum]|nr:hypothetical protein HBH82_039350 [Parastagonospora nodorum]KAH4693731.1 hypothetical protein HBH78_075340 [Parastagonospora nodorum]KAH4694350.1 hypothetical protein HBH67_215220 [Parastagonospora nodorum]KAH4789696.1 hypothetical protein HBH62_046520 [Parastagonospora nodorum]KAH4791635.1 hypothetical protein HBH63_097890 [Parastagonospora nodorum]
MAQRQICPSMGAIRRSLTVDVATISKTCTRSLSSSARNFEEQPSDGASSQPASSIPPTRRGRSEAALRQIKNLQNRRIQPGGLARGSFPSGQTAGRTSQEYNPSSFGASPAASEAGDTRAAGPRMARFGARPTTTHGSAPPEGGRMVRAPNMLRNRNANATVGSARGGPNLRGRAGGKGGDRGKDRAPKKREKGKDGDSGPSTKLSEIDPATTLSDGMIHNQMRLQRKEWDRVPYEPKYAPGSFAAQELIHEGRELFRGESPPVKIWGRLEKTIGVVGMFGAEAHLKVRRVPDGDDAPFGQEEAQEETQEEAQGNVEAAKDGTPIEQKQKQKQETEQKPEAIVQ